MENHTILFITMFFKIFLQIELHLKKKLGIFYKNSSKILILDQKCFILQHLEIDQNS